MTPRERVLTALDHCTPDRIPRDFWDEESTWKRLLAHVGHNDRARLLDDLGIDIRHLELAGPCERHIGEGVCQNFWGERYIYRQTAWGPMREDTRGALSDAQTMADLENFSWPMPDQFDHGSLVTQCEKFDDYAILYGFADVWQRPGLVRGWEGMFLDMATRPEWAHFLSRTFTDFYKEDYTRAAEATNERIDLYLLISDLGSQHGPLISVPMFREFVAPYLREMVDCIHGLGGKALFHSCGMIRPLIPELIELGIDVLDPIQPIGPEMSPEQLKAEFGDRLSFHGGIDMQHLLPHGTAEDVRAEVRRIATCLDATADTSWAQPICSSPTSRRRISWPCIGTILKVFGCSFGFAEQRREGIAENRESACPGSRSGRQWSRVTFGSLLRPARVSITDTRPFHPLLEQPCDLYPCFSAVSLPSCR